MKIKSVVKKSIIIIILVTIGFYSARYLGLLNKIRGFRFEDYVEAVEARAELLKHYPIGSPSEPLKRALEKAGADCSPITNPDFKDKPEYKNLIYCRYYERIMVIFVYDWRSMIEFNEKGSIQSLDVLKDIETIPSFPFSYLNTMTSNTKK